MLINGCTGPLFYMKDKIPHYFVDPLIDPDVQHVLRNFWKRMPDAVEVSEAEYVAQMPQHKLTTDQWLDRLAHLDAWCQWVGVDRSEAKRCGDCLIVRQSANAPYYVFDRQTELLKATEDNLTYALGWVEDWDPANDSEPGDWA